LKPPKKNHNLLPLSLSLCYSNKIYRSELLFLLISFLIPSASPTNQGPQQKIFRVQTTQDKQQQPSSLHKNSPRKPKNNETKLPFLDALEPSQKLHPREAQPSFVHEKKSSKNTKKEKTWRVSFTSNQRTKANKMLQNKI
jgi:hypothetical protein